MTLIDMSSADVDTGISLALCSCSLVGRLLERLNLTSNVEPELMLSASRVILQIVTVMISLLWGRMFSSKLMRFSC